MACPLALAAAAFLTCGWRGLAFFVVQAALRCVGWDGVGRGQHIPFSAGGIPTLWHTHAASRYLASSATLRCRSVVMLEVVNYIEHYGLQREKLENGR